METLCMKLFVLLGLTQAGKTAYETDFLAQGLTSPEPTIGIIITDNKTAMASKFKEDLDEDGNMDVVELSCKRMVSIEHICNYMYQFMEDWADGVPMPVFVAVGNLNQLVKINNLLSFCKKHMIKVRLIFDEADNSYCKFRNRMLSMDDEMRLVDWVASDTVVQCGFFTATEGNLFEFPEIKSAQRLQFKAHLQSDYMGVMDDNCKKMIYSKQKNNSRFLRHVINTNLDHFKTPYRLRDGSLYYRKILVVGGMQIVTHESDGQFLYDKGFNVIIDNSQAITLYLQNERHPLHYQLGKRSTNRVLFNLYEKYELQNAPLVLLSNRKMTRAVTYHWAPRDNSPALIWTEMILPPINDVDRVAQVAGRGCGKIKNALEYCGEFTYHSTAKNIEIIEKQAREICEFNKDHHNEKKAGQAREDAKHNIHLEDVEFLANVQHDPISNDCQFKVFDTQEEARKYAHNTLGKIVLRRKDDDITKCDRNRLKLAAHIKLPTVAQVVGTSGMWNTIGARFDKTPLRMIPVIDENRTKWLLFWDNYALNNRDDGEYTGRKHQRIISQI